MNEELREIGAVWRGEIERALKSSRIVSLLALYLVFTVLALGLLGYINYQGNQSLANLTGGTATPDQLLSQKKAILGVVYDEPLLTALLPLPIVLIFVFKLSMMFVPLFVGLMGFDQVSGDVGPKSIRYYVVRVRRSSLALGKFFTQAALYAALMTTCILLMTIVARALNSDFAIGDVFKWFALLNLIAWAFGFAYLGLTALCSSIVRTPAISLTLNVMLLFVLWAVAFVGERFFLLPGEKAAAGSLGALLKTESSAGYLRYLSVWHFESDLMHPAVWQATGSVLVHLGFAMLCLGTAMVVLKRRDV